MKKMFVIRALVMLLCLILPLAVFVACDPASGTEETENTTEGGSVNAARINASNCVIFVPADANEDANAAAEVLAAAMKEYAGVDVTVKNDSEAADADAIEILIGSTNRAESENALSAMNGQKGYVVKRDGSKIVLNATSSSMLDDAVTYFVNNCVSGASNGAFEVANDLCHTYGATGGFSLLDADNACQYKVVFSKEVDTEPNTRTDSNGNQIDTYNKGLDYIYPHILDCWEAMNKRLNLTIPVDIDYGTAADESYEILLGNTNRPETKTFLETLAPNEYGYAVIGNKLVVAGWGDFTSGLAIDLFIEDFKNYVVEDGDVKNLVMDGDARKVASYDKWSLDIPLFEGGDLTGIVDLLDNGLELYYLNASADAFRAYRAQLEAASFDLWQENEIAGNLYATYYTSKTMVHAYYLAHNNSVRVITESMRTAVLPQNEDPNMGEKVTDVTFTMFDLDESVGNFGNCFLITLEDGSFILHDGGFDKTGTNERDELYRLMKKLNKRKDGEIVIAAWFISHAHGDHFENTQKLLKQYSKNITVEKIIYSEPGETTIYNSYNPSSYISNGSLDQIEVWTSAEMIKFHTGQTIQIRNLKITAMLTVDDIYPVAVEKFNNTSLITRFTVGEGDDAQTMMIVGDTEEVGSKLLVDIYGDALKCDILQVAHHGYGGSIELYAKCEPKIVVWPKDQKAVDAQLKGTGYYPTINQSLVNQKNVLLVVVADDGHKTISLPLLGLSSDSSKNQKLVVVTERSDGRA